MLPSKELHYSIQSLLIVSFKFSCINIKRVIENYKTTS